MSKKERGVIQLIWKNFVASFQRNTKQPKLIGEDYYGTKYYETQTTTKSKPSRYFVPVDKINFEQELPAEWESWLRHRRIDPPTKEELEQNYQIALTKKKNAAQIKATYSKTTSQISELPVGKKVQSFPVYEEYKNDGSDYKIKHQE
ncbi:NADH dehydrogenase [ubiquinone] 1 alpha subcomplex assembly factor 2 [Ptiloglossa arizonensis]|uniref:NADH dehydrogenase [ubiquinone] 1 alpha subcomplex assembly factor 2 n=1 Tax=Ptiloglossa arizonensis TaxID=3350558 RepID=UPI003FA18A37